MPPSDERRSGRPLRYIIVGAGMAGLLAAIRLLDRGERDVTIYEKGDAVGGTWRDNTYPGLTCDVPAHSYTYSFAPNPEWSAYFAPGPEIRAYFEDIARRRGLHHHIRFGAEVARCAWSGGAWTVTDALGRQDRADVVIAATGVLHHPKYPDIPGLADFAGACFHSARWDHDAPLDGRRIGVIGNGSTGVQIVSALAGRAGHLVQFQRTPQWIMPVPDVHYGEEERRAFRDDPALIEAVRNGPEALARRARFTSAIIDADSAELAEIQGIVERNLEESVTDPVLREKLRPDYRVACKRLVFSPGYYAAVQQPGVLIETGTIARIEPEGVRMADGTLHPLDVLVLATGFHADRFVRPASVIGADGADLDAWWRPNPRAYFAVAVPHFPNFFLLNGPTGPAGNFSLIDIAEKQWAYVDQLIDFVRDETCDAIAPTETALLRYEAARRDAVRKTVFASGCASWYLGADGEPQVWPWSYDRFVAAMAKPDLDDYVLMRTGARTERV